MEKDKFIGFVDILGWKEKMKAAEAGTGMTLAELKELQKDLGTASDRDRIRAGPEICPQSTYIQRDLDFQLTQDTDCVIVSSEVSPAGVINLVNYCWRTVIKLLKKGIMCRGDIIRGLIDYTNDKPTGPGFDEAIGKEHTVSAFKRNAEERGTPFVVVDPAVCAYVRNYGDSCVKEMFSSSVLEDPKKMTTLFPFKRLEHSFIIGDYYGHKFDREEERQSNENVRSMIKTMKDHVMALVNRSIPDAMSKAEHYIAALDAQLDVCDKTDQFIKSLPSHFRSHWNP